jgi:DNA-3-methyladenine glycosylase II
MASRKSARLSNGMETASAREAAAAAMPPPPTKNIRKRKTPYSPKMGDPKAFPETPVTPPKKRRTTKAAAPPISTPTPSVVKLIAEPTTPERRKPARKPSTPRIADPQGTNAPLVSPETSKIVASRKADYFSSPSKANGVTTTANLLETACAHLISVDERMRPLIEKHHCALFSPQGLAEEIDPFEALSSGIISQQVSGAAAKAIKGRFVDLFDLPPSAEASGDRRFPHPSQVSSMPIERLRTAGLSQRKAEYIQGLAEKFASGELSAHLLADAPYENVLDRLTAVRGLGKWSVEMFACFALKRMDVFSTGDLGVQRGCAAFVGRDVARLKNKGGKWKYMNEQDMLELSERFKPYRTLFMWYMWRVEETDVSTME